MGSETALLREAFRAEIAAEGPLPGVDHQMLMKAGLGGESGRTLRTLEGFLA